MSDLDARTDAAISRAPRWLSKIEGISLQARERAARCETERRVPRETIEACREAGLFRTLQPKRFGGDEGDYGHLVDASVALSKGCASTAWVCGLYMAHNWLASLFPGEGQDEIWGDNPGAVIAGSYAPAGTAELLDGGLRISGRFQFSSGCDGADWILCGTMIPPDNEGEKPTPGFAIVPRSECKIDYESWKTVGLAGTGSFDVLVEEVFVPWHRMLRFSDAASGKAPGTAVNTADLYRYPFLSCVPYSLAMPSVGAALGAVEDFLEVTGTRETRGAVVSGGNKVAGFAAVQSRVGLATAALDAALAVARRDYAELKEEVARTGAISLDTRMRNRRSQSWIAHQAREAVEAMFEVQGGMGLALSNRVQRAWRDVHAVCHHISLNWDAVMSMYGQHRLGLTPQGQY